MHAQSYSFVKSIEPDKQNEFKSNFDIALSTGVSIPIGKFSLPTDASDDRSSAGIGGFSEIYASLQPLAKSPWRIAATIGYMHQPFETHKSMQSYNIPLMNATSWNSFYFLAGIGYTSKSKILVGIKADVGVMGFEGGDIVSANYNNNTMHVRSWQYSMQAVGVVKASLKLGYRINNKLHIFVDAAILHAAALRNGQLSSKNYVNTTLLNSRVLNSIHEKSVEIENQTTIFVVNCGFGLCYAFNKKTESMHYQLNVAHNL